MSIKEIILPSSGRTIRMKSVNGPKVLLMFQRLFPPPMPKYQEVNYGTEKKPEMRGEYNYASPEYLAQKEAYSAFQYQWLNDPILSLKLMIDSLILTESDKQEVDKWIEVNGNPDNLSQKYIYFEEILSIEPEDFEAIKEATSPPAPEEVRAIAESFPS